MGGEALEAVVEWWRGEEVLSHHVFTVVVPTKAGLGMQNTKHSGRRGAASSGAGWAADGEVQRGCGADGGRGRRARSRGAVCGRSEREARWWAACSAGEVEVEADG